MIKRWILYTVVAIIMGTASLYTLAYLPVFLAEPAVPVSVPESLPPPPPPPPTASGDYSHCAKRGEVMINPNTGRGQVADGTCGTMSLEQWNHQRSLVQGSSNP